MGSLPTLGRWDIYVAKSASTLDVERVCLTVKGQKCNEPKWHRKQLVRGRQEFVEEEVRRHYSVGGLRVWRWSDWCRRIREKQSRRRISGNLRPPQGPKRVPDEVRVKEVTIRRVIPPESIVNFHRIKSREGTGCLRV